MASMISAILLTVYGGLVLLQLWFEVFPGHVFWKITITFFVIITVVVGVSLIKHDYFAEKQMKKDKFID